MSRDVFYPQPPHLSIAVWSPEDEESVFGRACEAAAGMGCVATGQVELAPRGQRFALLQDLPQRTKVTLASEAFEAAVHGGDPVLRPLRAAFRAKGLGVVVVEHLFGTEEEPHPVAISLSAGSLGLPEQLRTSSERKSADDLADWAGAVLQELAMRCNAAYGAVGVEETLPTPSALRDGESVGNQPFISSNLPKRVQVKFESALAGSPGTRWSTGQYFPGWNRSADLTAASLALGRFLDGSH